MNISDYEKYDRIWPKDDQEEICLIKRWFEDQGKLPLNRQRKSCMIYCGCSNCNRAKL